MSPDNVNRDDAGRNIDRRRAGTFGSASPELRELVRAVCDETITPKQRDRLEEILRSDENARLFYLAHVDMWARLQFTFRGSIGDEADIAGAAEEAPRGILPRLLGPASDLLDHRSLSLWGLFIALCVAGAWLYYSSLSGHDATPHLASPQPQWVARLGRTAGAKWAVPGTGILQPDFLPGAELELIGGLAEVSFINGVMLILEGPAKLRIESETFVRLVSGKVRAEVPSEAIGFVVATDRAKVVDRGTIFGVEVGREGDTEIQVFKGKVDAEARNPRQVASRFFQLSEGESLRIGGGDEPVVSLNTDPAAYPHLPLPSPAERWDRWQAYRQRLLNDSDLAAYWSFDEADARDISGNGNDGVLMNSPWFPAESPEIVGGGRCLDVSGGPKFVLVAHSYSLEFYDELSVSLWMRGGSRQKDWARLIGKGGAMNCSGWVMHRAADRNVVRTVVGNSLYCNQSIANVSGIYDARWHHLVVTMKRGYWQAFVDGEFHSHGTYNHQEGLRSDVDLVIGAAGADQSILGSLDFEGQIDEVALIRRALSPDEVRRIHSAGSGRLGEALVSRPPAQAQTPPPATRKTAWLRGPWNVGLPGEQPDATATGQLAPFNGQ